MHFLHLLLNDSISSLVIQNTLHEADWGRTLDEDDVLSEDEQKEDGINIPAGNASKIRSFESII